MSNRVEEAYALFVELRKTEGLLKRHQKLARSPLPKKKQPLFDRLATQCLIKDRNIRSRLQAKTQKLTMGDRLELSKLLGPES